MNLIRIRIKAFLAFVSLAHSCYTPRILMRWLALFLSVGGMAVLAATPEEEFVKDIKPIFEKHCYECHNSEKHKGDLNLAVFETYDQVAAVPEVFANVLERVQAFEMPPPGKNELNGDKPNKLARFLRALPQPDQADCQKLASDRSANFYRGYLMSRRLNRAEYHNTIRDLLGLEVNVEDLLPTDGGGGEGFDTTGNALFTSTIHIENYMAAADRILTEVFANKSATQKLLLGNASPKKKVANSHARQVLKNFQRLAYRRPAGDDEIDRSMILFDRVYKRGDGFVPAIRLALKSVLISPNFLFLAEPEPAERGVQTLGAIPLASKLSYFLWSTMPDEEMMKLAESGDLLKPDIYKAQIKRLMADPKSMALGERFALQWLEIERLGSEVNPDAKQFPEFTPQLREAMREEVAATFNYVFRNDRPLIELLDADYAFVNQQLAAIYGIPQRARRRISKGKSHHKKPRRSHRHGRDPRAHVFSSSHKSRFARSLDSRSVARRKSSAATTGCSRSRSEC